MWPVTNEHTAMFATVMIPGCGSKLDPDQKHEEGCNEVQVYCRKGQIKITAKHMSTANINAQRPTKTNISIANIEYVTFIQICASKFYIQIQYHFQMCTL